MSDVELMKMSSDEEISQEKQMEDSDTQQVKNTNPPRRGRGKLTKHIDKEVDEDESAAEKTPKRGRRRSLRKEDGNENDGNENEGNDDEYDSNKEKSTSGRDRGRRSDREMRKIIEIEEEEDSDTQDVNPTKSPRRGKERSSNKIDTNVSDAGQSPSRERGTSHTSEDENEVNEDEDCDEKNSKIIKNLPGRHRGKGSGRGKGRLRGKERQDNEDDENDLEDSDIEKVSTTNSPSRGRGLRQKNIKKVIDDDDSGESPSRGRGKSGKNEDEMEDEKDGNDNNDNSLQVKESPDRRRGKVRGRGSTPGKGKGRSSGRNPKPISEDEEQKDDEGNSLGEGLEIRPEDFMFMVEEETEPGEDQVHNIGIQVSAVEKETKPEAHNICSEDSAVEEEIKPGEDQVQNICTEDSTLEEEIKLGESQAQNICSEDLSAEKEAQNICSEDFKIAENTKPGKDEDQNKVQNNQEHEDHADFIDFGVEETDLYESEEDNFEVTEEKASNNHLLLEEDKKDDKSIQNMEEDQIEEGKIQNEMQRDELELVSSKNKKENAELKNKSKKMEDAPSEKGGSIFSRLGPPIKRNNDHEDGSEKSDNDSDNEERKSKRSKMMSEREDLTNSPVKDDDSDSDGGQEKVFKIPGMCFKYNTRGKCLNRNCKWPHRCDECGGDHPKCKCSIRKQRREKEIEKKESSKETGPDDDAKDGNDKEKITKMFVNSQSKNLSNVSGNDMRKAFIQFGAIKSVTIPRHCGFAFIDFEDPESVDRAIKFGENNPIRVKKHILNPGQPSKSNRGESEKRKAPEDLRQKIKHAKTDNQEPIPRTKRKKLYCNVCQIPLGFMSIEDHVESSRHEDNIVRVSSLLGLDRKVKLDVDSAIKTSIELNFVKKVDNSDNEFACLICSSDFDDRKVLGEHLRKISHMKIIKEVLKKNQGSSNPPIYIKDLSSGQSSELSQANQPQKTESQKSEMKEDNLSISTSNQELSQQLSESKDAETSVSDIFTSKGNKSKKNEKEEIASSVTKSTNLNEKENCKKSESKFSCEPCSYSGPISELSKHYNDQVHIERILLKSANDRKKCFTEELPEENKDKIESSCDKRRKKETVKLSIPTDKCKNITGRGGVELLAICNQSKAEILFDESTKSAKHGLFNIKGTKRQIEIARQLIFDKVGVISSQSIQESSGEQEEKQLKLELENTEASSDIIKTVHFRLPAKKCGQVIGKGRCELTNISQKTGAMITIDKTSQKNQQFRTFIIKGTQIQIKEAKEMMTERADANLTVDKKVIDEKKSNVKIADVLNHANIGGIPKSMNLRDLMRNQNPVTLLPLNVNPVVVSGFPLQQTKIMQQMIPNPVLLSGVALQPMLAQAAPPMLSSNRGIFGSPPKVMKQKPSAAFPPPPRLQSNVTDYSHRPANVMDYSHAAYPTDYSHGAKKIEMNMSDGILGSAPLRGAPSIHDTSSDLTPVPMKEDSDDDIPSDINIAKSKLFLGNLPKGLSEEIMKKLLNICGEVGNLECELIDGYIESCCTVTFRKVVSVYHAHRHLNGITVMDKKIIATILLKDVQKENESRASYHKSDQSIIQMILDNYVSDMKSSRTNRSRSPARSHKARGNASSSRNNQRSRSPLNKNEPKYGRQREIQCSKSPKHENIPKHSGNYEESLNLLEKKTGSEFVILNLNQEIGENLLFPMLKDCSQITNYMNKQGKFVLKFGDGEIAVLLAKVLNGIRFPDRCLLVENFDSILHTNVNDLKFNVMENFVSDGFKNNQHRFINFWQSLSKSSEDLWMNYLMMDNWRDAYVAGLGKTYHILVESIIKLHKFRINAQVSDGVYVLVVTPTTFVAQCLTSAVQRLALEYKQYVVTITEDQFGTGGGSVVVGTASGIIEMMRNSSRDLRATLKVLILDDASKLLKEHMAQLRNITNALTENPIKSQSRINLNKIAVVENVNQQEVNSLSTLLKCVLFVEGSSSVVPRSHTENQSGFSRAGQAQISRLDVNQPPTSFQSSRGQAQISRLDANQPPTSFQSSRGRQWSSTKQGESSTSRFGSKEAGRNPRSVYSSSIQKGLSDSNQEAEPNTYYGLNVKQIAHATLGKDSIVTKDLIRTYLKAQGVTPVQEIVFHIASAVSSEQLKMNDSQPTSKSHKSNDWQLDLEEVGDEINVDDKVNTMSGYKQGNQDLAPKYGSSGRKDERVSYGSDQQSGLLKMPDNRLQHGSNQQSGSLPKQDTSARSYGSRGREDDRLLRMSGTIKNADSLQISDTSGRPYGSRGRDDDSLMQRNPQQPGLLSMPDTSGRPYGSRGRDDDNLMQRSTQQPGLLSMPDTSGRSFDYGGKIDDSLMQRRSTQQLGLLSMSNTSGEAFGSRGRDDDSLMQRSTQQPGLLSMPNTSGRSFGSRGKEDNSLMQRNPQQQGLLSMPDTLGRPYGSRGREDGSLMQRSTQQPGLLSMPDTSGRSFGSRGKEDDSLMQRNPQQQGLLSMPDTSGRPYGSRGREDDSLMQRSTQQPGLLSMQDTSGRPYGTRSREDDRLLMGGTIQQSGMLPMSETLGRSYGSRDRGREDDRLRPTSRFDRMEPTSGSSLLGNYSLKGSQDEYRERMYMRRESGTAEHENTNTSRERLPMNRSLPNSHNRY